MANDMHNAQHNALKFFKAKGSDFSRAKLLLTGICAGNCDFYTPLRRMR